MDNVLIVVDEATKAFFLALALTLEGEQKPQVVDLFERFRASPSSRSRR